MLVHIGKPWQLMATAYLWALTVAMVQAEQEINWDELAGTETAASQDRAGRDGIRIFRARVTPHWVGENTQFWYRNDLANGTREFIFVNALTAERGLAFDHSAVATALGSGFSADRLPIESLEYNAAGSLVALLRNGRRYLWDAYNRTLTEASRESQKANANTNSEQGSSIRSTSRTGADSSITFDNRLSVPVEILWLSGDGSKQSYGKIEPGKNRVQHTLPTRASTWHPSPNCDEFRTANWFASSNKLISTI